MHNFGFKPQKQIHVVMTTICPNSQVAPSLKCMGLKKSLILKVTILITYVKATKTDGYATMHENNNNKLNF